MSGKFRVLCVDDNRDIADSSAKLLRICGFEACVCYDGPTALRMAEEFRPGICFLDYNMPGMSGGEVAVRLRWEEWCPSLLVLMSAFADFDSHQEMEAFDLRLLKPVDPEKMVRVVDALFQATEGESMRRDCLTRGSHTNR